VAPDLSHHSAQLAHPELHSQRHQRTLRRILRWIPCPSDEGQQSIQHWTDMYAGAFGKRPLHLLLQIDQRDDLPLQELEQIDEEEVLLQQLAQRTPPCGMIHILRS